jgi:transcriptional regulator with GAF, ATPase, and Fis domain
VAKRIGRFELAHGGTLFLDEVGDIPLELQPKLLRVLQEHEFEHLGSTRTQRVDVRMVAATNRNLEQMVRDKQFREDLYFRLNVFPIRIPPLRERVGDIPLLVRHYMNKYAQRMNKRIETIPEETMSELCRHIWPGNIRELQNVIERSVIVCDTKNFSVAENWQPTSQPLADQPLADKLMTQEKEMIEAALAESRGRVFGRSGAAAKLGIPYTTLESKIRSLKIDKHRFKSAPHLQ